MLKHTKIVATVSDQRCEVEFIDALYKAGMNVVRLNTAHMAEEGLTRVVNNVRNFCFPVKNGWHFEQTSTRMSFFVEPVSITLPQAHVIVVC